MRRTTPWIPVALVLLEVHTIADVLFTGGRPIAAIAAAVFLVAWAWLASLRNRKPTDASSR